MSSTEKWFTNSYIKETLRSLTFQVIFISNSTAVVNGNDLHLGFAYISEQKSCYILKAATAERSSPSLRIHRLFSRKFHRATILDLVQIFGCIQPVPGTPALQHCTAAWLMPRLLGARRFQRLSDDASGV